MLALFQRQQRALLASFARRGRHPLSAVHARSPFLLSLRLLSNPAQTRDRDRKFKGDAKNAANIGTIDFTTMGEVELERLLKAAEFANSDLSKYFSRIHQVIERCPRFDSANALARAVYALRRSNGLQEGAADLLQAVAVRLRSSREQFNAVQICKCMSGLRLMSSDSKHVRAVLDAMCSVLLRSGEQLDYRSFGTILYSMKCMNSNSPEARKFLKIMADKLEAYQGDVDGQCIGNMLFGLRGMSSEYAEVKAIVSAIAFKIPEQTTVMKSQELGNALYGLQSMSSDALAVRETLLALSTQLTRYMAQFDESVDEDYEEDGGSEGDFIEILNPNRVSKFSLSPQEISNALYGLQKMSDTHRDTRNVLTAILPAVRNPTEAFSSQAVGLSLYGLQSMTASSKEVRRILDAMAEQTSRCPEPLSAQTVGNALYGLKSMDCSSAEVRRLLSALAKKIKEDRGGLNLSGQAVGNALYGLKNMSSDEAEVQELVGVLADAVAGSSCVLNGQAVGNALYGLSCMSTNSEPVVRLVEALSAKVSSCKDPLSAQAVSNALYGMQNLNSSSDAVRNLLAALVPKIYSCNEPANGQNVGNALYGLRSASISAGSGVRDVVGALAHYFYLSTKAHSQSPVSPSLHDEGSKPASSKTISSEKLLELIRSDRSRGVIPLTGKTAGMALFGLRGMGSAHTEVRALLAALLPSIQATTRGLDGQFIGNALYGLQEMSCEEEEVRALVQYVVEKMNSPRIGVMSAQEVSNALFGFRNMELRDESRAFLTAILSHLSECSDNFSPLALAECFMGMQQMDFCEETAAVMSLLSDRLDQCIDPFSMSHISMICYALKSLDDSAGQVLSTVLDKLFGIVCTSQLLMGPEHAANILYGLCRCPQSGRALLGLTIDWCLRAGVELEKFQSERLLEGSTERLLEGSTELCGQNVASWRALCQNLQLFLEADQQLLDEVARPLNSLCHTLNRVLPKHGSTHTDTNDAEHGVRSSLLKALGADTLKCVSVSEKQEYLYSFQSDIVVRGKNMAGLEVIVNVEVDGLTHRRVGKSDFCTQRDRFLAARQVHVVRITRRGGADSRRQDIAAAATTIRELLEQ